MYNKPKENREKALNKPFFLIFGASTPRSLANATFLVENRHTCDHLVDASIKTIKYLNGPQCGRIDLIDITLNSFQ